MRRSPVAGVLYRRGHRPGAGFAFAQSAGDVRDRQDTGGLFRGVHEPALRRAESRRAAGAEFLLLLLSPVFLLGAGRALLGEALDFDLQTTLVVAVLNALVAVPLFHILDKLKVTD